MSKTNHIEDRLLPATRVAKRKLKAAWSTVRFRDRTRAKEAGELAYWRQRFVAERGALGHAHYRDYFTKPFGLEPDDFAGARVLDIGCGPRGTLEWATDATERVGLDTLVDEYRAFGIEAHAMAYVNGGAEAIPYPDGHFDIVASLNSLDHVEDIGASIREIKRVTRRGGLFLLVVEVDHPATVEEPHTLPRTFTGWFAPEFAVEGEAIRAVGPDHDVAAAALGDSVAGPGPAVLVARLRRM